MNIKNIWLDGVKYRELQDEKQVIADKWDKHGLLINGMKDEQHKINLACVLESQRLHSKNENDAAFVRLSIPLVRRIWFGCLTSVIVSVQPVLHNDQDFYRRNSNGLIYSCGKVAAISSLLRARWNPPLHKTVNNLESEEGYCAALAFELQLEIDRYVCTTLCNNCGIVGEWNFQDSLADTIKERYEELYVKIVKASDQIKNRIGFAANWIVTSPEIASIFETTTTGFEPRPDVFALSAGIDYVGTINGHWKLYKDTAFTSRILMGYKSEDDLNPGFVYYASTTLTKVDGIFDPGSVLPKCGLMTRRAVKMPNPSFYARIDVKDFVI